MKAFFITSGAVLAVFMSASALQAGSFVSPCPTDPTETLDAYERIVPSGDGRAKFSCAVGILDFTDFNFSATGTPGAPLLAASDIVVTPVSSGALGGGFNFSPIDGTTFSVAPGQTATYVIDWFMRIDPGPIAMDADLGMDPPSGDVTITQTYCADTALDDGGGCPTGFQTLTVSTLPIGLKPGCDTVLTPVGCSDHLVFSPFIMNFAEVETTISLKGDLTGSHFDSMTGTTDVTDTSSAPEPFSFTLGLGGLLAVGLFKKRGA